MSRTPQQVFQHHGQALGAEDFDEIVADYSDDGEIVMQTVHATVTQKG